MQTIHPPKRGLVRSFELRRSTKKGSPTYLPVSSSSAKGSLLPAKSLEMRPLASTTFACSVCVCVWWDFVIIVCLLDAIGPLPACDTNLPGGLLQTTLTFLHRPQLQNQNNQSYYLTLFAGLGRQRGQNFSNLVYGILNESQQVVEGVQYMDGSMRPQNTVFTHVCDCRKTRVSECVLGRTSACFETSSFGPK